MFLRDHAPSLRPFGAAVESAVIFAVAAIGSIVALAAVRGLAPLRLRRWLGA